MKLMEHIKKKSVSLLAETRIALLLNTESWRESSVKYYVGSNTLTTNSSQVLENDDISNSYKMAAQVAVCAAIIVAMTILLALIWNSLKRRLPETNDSGMSTTISRRRYSSDSFDRLVEDRLRNRPPPYSPDQDKPPSYEESFHDLSVRRPSPVTRTRERQIQESSNTNIEQLSDIDWIPSQTSEVEPSRHVQLSYQRNPNSSPNLLSARIVSYDNRAYTSNEPSAIDIPSISVVVYQNEMFADDNEDECVMLHL